MAAAGIGVAELSRRSGVHKATIHRVLREDYEFVPSSRTLDKLATALVDEVQDRRLDAVLNSPDASHYVLPVRMELGVDRWFVQGDTYAGASPLVYNDRIPRKYQWLGRVSDLSADIHYAVGDLVHFVETPVFSALSIAPGDHVVVGRRRQTEEGTTEFRIFLVSDAQPDQGRLSLEAPTKQARFQSKFEMRDGLLFGDQVQSEYTVALVGLVIGQYRKRHFLAS